MEESQFVSGPDDELDILISKHASGKATDEEERRLREELERRAENDLQLKDYPVLLEMGAELVLPPAADKNLVWKEIKDRIESDASKPSIAWYRSRKLMLTAIAAVMLTSLAIWKINGPKTDSRLPAQQLITFKTQDDSLSNKLPDGSMVYLSRHSELSFPARFSGSTRDVRLRGTCFFNIAHDSSLPFIVETGDLKIKVLGTSFQVSNTALSTEVSVSTGFVELNWKRQKLRLAAGDRSIVYQGDTLLSILQNAPVPDTVPPAKATVHKVSQPNSLQTHFEYSDNPDKQKQVMKEILNEIVKQKLAPLTDSVRSLVLTEKQMLINEKSQNQATHQKFIDQFPCPPGYGYYYGDVKISGKGIFLYAEDIDKKSN
jgi:transmembrane sensor